MAPASLYLMIEEHWLWSWYRASWSTSWVRLPDFYPIDVLRGHPPWIQVIARWLNAIKSSANSEPFSGWRIRCCLEDCCCSNWTCQAPYPKSGMSGCRMIVSGRLYEKTPLSCELSKMRHPNIQDVYTAVSGLMVPESLQILLAFSENVIAS